MITNNKEQLTQATMEILQGQAEDEFDTNENCKQHLERLFECYADEDNITEFINTLMNLVLKFADNEGILYILNWCQDHNI